MKIDRYKSKAPLGALFVFLILFDKYLLFRKKEIRFPVRVSWFRAL